MTVVELPASGPNLLAADPPPGLHPQGLPIAFALANPKVDEGEVARDHFEVESNLLASRPGQTILADKGYASPGFGAFLKPTTTPTSSDTPARASVVAREAGS